MGKTELCYAISISHDPKSDRRLVGGHRSWQKHACLVSATILRSTTRLDTLDDADLRRTYYKQGICRPQIADRLTRHAGFFQQQCERNRLRAAASATEEEIIDARAARRPTIIRHCRNGYAPSPVANGGRGTLEQSQSTARAIENRPRFFEKMHRFAARRTHFSRDGIDNGIGDYDDTIKELMRADQVLIADPIDMRNESMGGFKSSVTRTWTTR